MKKLGKILLATMVTLSLLVACGGSGGAAGGKVKLGVASVQHVSETADRKTDEPGAEFITVVAGVALQDDKVAYVKIDESQQYAYVRGGDVFEGEAQKTKGEKKEAYGMKDQSTKDGLGKEWYEQVEALEAAIIGKTKDEVKAYFSSEEVKTASTMYLDDMAAAVLKAIDNTVEVSGVSKVGLGYQVAVNVKGDGLKPESVLDYALIAVDADGKIVKALLDNAQEKAELKDGEIVYTNVGKTKGELKEAYGMKEFGPEGAIGKEWNEQNDALMEYFVGKTPAEVTALDADAKNIDDINSSVTIVIAGAQAAVKNAEANLTELK